MNYWIIDNGNRRGPFTMEQIRAMHLSPQTPVWRTGMPDWTTAGQLPELSQWLDESRAMPPLPDAPEQCERRTQKYQPMPPTYLAFSIVATVLCCLIPGIIAIIYSTKVEGRFREGDYAGARRASDNALMWIIASVVFAFVTVPLQIAVMML